jgi:thiamine-phosphate pyrophosphorylase
MLPRLHLVTDDALLRDPDFAARADEVLTRCGVDIALHLRGHETQAHALHQLGERLAATTLRTGAWLFVNDRVDIAMAIRARGVQLGVRSIPIAAARMLLGHGARIGYSAHGALEAGRASAEGADFVMVGTIFKSASHANHAPAGVRLIRACAVTARVPVIAIGGVTVERVAELAAAQAYGVAVLSGIWSAAEPADAAASFVSALQQQLGRVTAQ